MRKQNSAKHENEITPNAKIKERQTRKFSSLADKIDAKRMGAPAFLMVVTGGRYAYTRSDGVLVVPIACLSH